MRAAILRRIVILLRLLFPSVPSGTAARLRIEKGHRAICYPKSLWRGLGKLDPDTWDGNGSSNRVVGDGRCALALLKARATPRPKHNQGRIVCSFLGHQPGGCQSGRRIKGTRFTRSAQCCHLRINLASCEYGGLYVLCPARVSKERVWWNSAPLSAILVARIVVPMLAPNPPISPSQRPAAT